MKLSEVTIDELKQYANVYTSDDDNLFATILIAGKSFIGTYTGLPLIRDSNVPVVNGISPGSPTISGTSTAGYTITATFQDNTTITGTVQSDGTWTLNVPVTEILNKDDVIQVTQTTPSGYVSAATVVTVRNSQAPYPNCGDDFEDLTIVLFTLANEMYDNRDFVVDNDKLNFVVKQILDSYSVNLL